MSGFMPIPRGRLPKGGRSLDTSDSSSTSAKLFQVSLGSLHTSQPKICAGSPGCMLGHPIRLSPESPVRNRWQLESDNDGQFLSLSSAVPRCPCDCRVSDRNKYAPTVLLCSTLDLIAADSSLNHTEIDTVLFNQFNRPITQHQSPTSHLLKLDSRIWPSLSSPWQIDTFHGERVRPFRSSDRNAHTHKRCSR
jgi:hypothetical protein